MTGGAAGGLEKDAAHKALSPVEGRHYGAVPWS